MDCYMKYTYCLLAVVFLLCQKMYAGTTVDINIGYDITSTHDKDDMMLQCCFKLRNTKNKVILRWNITTEESTVMLYKYFDKSYILYSENSYLLKDTALFKFNTSNISVMHLSGNGTFTWRCGTELLPVDICLDQYTKSHITLLPGVIQTTECTTTNQTMEIYKITTFAMSAVISVLVVAIILAVIFHYKKKFKMKLSLETEPKSPLGTRNKSYLENVTYDPEYKNIELQPETIVIHGKTAESNHRVQSHDSNKKSMSNANNNNEKTSPNGNKRKSYGPKFYPCLPKQTKENPKTDGKSFLNKPYYLMEPGNKQVPQKSLETPTNGDEICVNSENMSDNEGNLQTDEKAFVNKYYLMEPENKQVPQKSLETPTNSDEILENSENMSEDERNLENASTAQNKEFSKLKRHDHKETVKVIPGKINTLVLLKSN